MKNLIKVIALVAAVSTISMVFPLNLTQLDEVDCRKEKKEQCTRSKGDICFTTSGCKKRGAEYSEGGELLPI